MKSETGIKPDLTLSMDEKIYLAVATEQTEKLAFIYVLVCLKKQGATYNMLANKEIYTFKNKDMAALYYATIEKIIEKNTENKILQPLFVMNEALIEQFYEKSK